MRIFNEERSMEISGEDLDLNLGYLMEDKLITKKIPDTTTTKSCDDGSIEITKIPAFTETEDILVYIPYTKDEILNNLRYKRKVQCFDYINRGEAYWNSIWAKFEASQIEEKKNELNNWYKAWLDITLTKQVPIKPVWLE